jgi:hypothetical protein
LRTADGADILIVDINADKMTDVADEIKELNKVTVQRLTSAAEQGIYTAVESVERRSAAWTSWSTIPASRRS